MKTITELFRPVTTSNYATKNLKVNEFTFKIDAVETQYIESQGYVISLCKKAILTKRTVGIRGYLPELRENLPHYLVVEQDTNKNTILIDGGRFRVVVL